MENELTDRPGHKPVQTSTPSPSQPPAKRQRLSERLYLPLVDHALPDTLIVHDHYGRIIEVNKHASSSLGYSRAQLLAMQISALEPALEAVPHSTEAQTGWAQLKPGRRAIHRGR